MDLKTVLRIQIITLSDSICFGLIYAFINPYLLILSDGDNVIVGIFTVLNLLCQLVCADVTKLLTGQAGKQFSLFLLSLIATISYLLITLTNSYWFVIISRCLFTITNQTNSLCREILLKNIPKNEAEYFLSVHNILSSVGYIIGPIVTGCLFSSGFSYSCFLAAALTFGNVWFSTTLNIVDEDADERNSAEEKSLVNKTTEDVVEVLRNFESSNIKENWDLMTLKFLFTTSISIFFSKFTQILKYNFDADAIAIGSTTSYMNGLVFACPLLVDNMMEKYELNKFSLMQKSLCTLLLSSILACYAPIFPFYLLMCIPLILSRCYLNVIWGELFTTRKNEALNKVNELTSLVAGLIIPIIFGIICNQIGHHAVVLFSVVPILLSFFVFFKRTIWSIATDDSTNDLKNKDE